MKYSNRDQVKIVKKSLPLRERGLKSVSDPKISARNLVAPLAGAWIEIFEEEKTASDSVSLPLRERGLKSDSKIADPRHVTSLPLRERGLKYSTFFPSFSQKESLPLRERGLKYAVRLFLCFFGSVAPLAGAWIEMFVRMTSLLYCNSRSPCGSVD